ncbi:hypothetical protein IV203_015542 [Nitzschia inconspicua]|uniref:Uncharacterized protein n=1 Tax=Nitzschia inconspicua TaxID=303405 RepID=A0A9K3LCD8_9STRA|nr:hypothetical protein IV203_015542 [Nitzschia inconspicua]
MPLLRLSISAAPLWVLLLAAATPRVRSFIPLSKNCVENTHRLAPRPLSTIPLASTPFSGSGWDNDNFLESLSKPLEEPPSWGPPLPSTFSPDTASSNLSPPPTNFQPPIPQPQQSETWTYSPPPPSPSSQINAQQDQHYNPYPVPPQPQESSASVPNANYSSNPSDDLPTADIEGALLTPEMKEKIKVTNENPEEEASQGGERFRKLMERARQQQQQQQQLQQTYQTPPSQQSPSLFQIPPDAMNLPVEDQARLFRELMARQQQMHPPQQVPPQQQQNYQTDPYQQQYAQMMQQQYQQLPPLPSQQYEQQYAQQSPSIYSSASQAQYPQLRTQQIAANVIYSPETSPYPNYLEPGVGFDGRKIGRNRDADTISNASDAYFAQLKRDSTTRNLARYAGDEQKANEIFHDPAIRDIQPPPSNPHLDERRQRERDMLETVPEEMLVFQEYDDQRASDKTYSGVSYKDKVAQLKARRNNTNNGNNA